MNDQQPDTIDWLNDPDHTSAFTVMGGSSAARRTALDEVVNTAQGRGVPVIRLDGTESSQWDTQLQIGLGPLSLSLRVQHQGPGASPTTTLAPAPAHSDTPASPRSNAPAPAHPNAPAPAHSDTPAPGRAPSSPAAGTHPTALHEQIQRLAEVALAHGGAVLAVDDLHRVPAAVRNELIGAVRASGAPILVVATATPSQVDRLERAADRTQPIAASPAATHPRAPHSAARHASTHTSGLGTALGRTA